MESYEIQKKMKKQGELRNFVPRLTKQMIQDRCKALGLALLLLQRVQHLGQDAALRVHHGDQPSFQFAASEAECF